MVLHKMYASLEAEQKKNLHAYFYVGKDQTKPINNKFKKRSCHSKLYRDFAQLEYLLIAKSQIDDCG